MTHTQEEIENESNEDIQIEGRFDRLLKQYKVTATANASPTHVGFLESVTNGELDDLIAKGITDKQFERVYLQNAVAKAINGQDLDTEEHQLLLDLYTAAVHHGIVHMAPEKLN
ncbi:MAG: hypothetical protein WC764_00600 [Candidatus Paceibacterota bacterium]|jgi:hypothetical protein